MAKNPIRIFNYTFMISSDSSADDRQYMEEVANKVERKVKTLSDEMSSRSMTEVALFVAMDYCDKYLKSTEDVVNLREQIKDYLQESNYVRKQLDEVTAENEALKAELETLRKRLSAGNAPNIAAPKKNNNTVSGNTFPSAAKASVVAEEKISPKAETLKKETKIVTEKPVSSEPTAKSKNRPSNPKSDDNSPIKGFFSNDSYGESADIAADIMSFFEQKAFENDDDDE